jgi:hypothetical protein
MTRLASSHDDDDYNALKPLGTAVVADLNGGPTSLRARSDRFQGRSGANQYGDAIREPDLTARNDAAGHATTRPAHKTPKIGDTHASISDARRALHLCEAMSTVSRDVELTQNRVTAALQKLTEPPPTDDYGQRRRH